MICSSRKLASSSGADYPGNYAALVLSSSTGSATADKGPLTSLVEMMGRPRAVDGQAELRPAVRAMRVHQLFAPVDRCEVEIGNHSAFTEMYRFADRFTFGRDDAVKQPPEIGQMLHPVSFMIWACWSASSQAVGLTTKQPD